MALTLTEEAVQYMIYDFISHPGRAKSRNIKIFMKDNDEEGQRSSDKD